MNICEHCQENDKSGNFCKMGYWYSNTKDSHVKLDCDKYKRIRVVNK